jgi:Na+-driven multidrug efflux pump
MFKVNKAMLMFFSFLISALVFILLFVIVYNIASMISPPYVEEENGERHGLMPIGQVFTGIVVSSIASIIALIVCYKKGKRKWNLK